MTTIDEREYWDRKEAMLREDLAADAIIAQDPNTKLHRLQVQYSATPDGDTGRRDQIRQEISRLAQQIKQDEEDRFLAEWTLDVTVNRRAAWNELARKGQDIVKCQKALGIRAHDLRRAIKAHNL